MEFDKIVEILKGEGHKKEIVYNDSEIKEIEPFQGGEYHFLVREGDNWRLGYVSMEREPEEEIIGIYSSKKEGANSFLLNRLRSDYLHRYISVAKKDTRISQLYWEGKLGVDDLNNALMQSNIPKNYLSTQNSNNHSIRVYEDNGGWVSEYRDINGVSLRRMKPCPLRECISFAFTRIMYLYLLDKVTEKYFDGKKSYEYFTSDEIAAYIS